MAINGNRKLANGVLEKEWFLPASSNQMKPAMVFESRNLPNSYSTADGLPDMAGLAPARFFGRGRSEAEPRVAGTKV